MAFKPGTEDHNALCDINVTPLVDVMLVLVIILLVTAPLLMQSIQVTLPKTQETTKMDETKPLQLEIDATGKVSLDKIPLADLATLDSVLKSRVAKEPEVPLYLYADQTVVYGKVAEVMAVVQESGVSKFAFVTIQQ